MGSVFGELPVVFLDPSLVVCVVGCKLDGSVVVDVVV